jgi:hypothetical protein
LIVYDGMRQCRICRVQRTRDWRIKQAQACLTQ